MSIDSFPKEIHVNILLNASRRKAHPELKVILHSYSFRDRPFSEACKAAHDFGYDGIELSRVHFDDERLDDELASAINTADSQGVPIVCVDFAGNFLSEDDRVRENSIALLDRNIRLCSEHGIELMNGHAGVLSEDSNDFGQNGSALASDAHYALAADALRSLGGTAAELGVTLALEIHMNTLHDTVASMARLLDQVDRQNVVATPDPGNMYATSTAERDPEALRRLGERIGYFHFKNCAGEAGNYDYSVDLEHGDIDLFRYLQVLNDLGYTGDVCIEHVGELDPRAVASRDIVYLRECMKRATHGG